MRDEKGAVLLLVLIMLVVLTAIVVQFMFSTSVDSRIVDIQLAQLKNNAAIDGGIAKAISLLLEDTADEENPNGNTDSPADSWGGGPSVLTFEDTKLRLLVLDEQGKININLLAVSASASRVRAELERLLQTIGMDEFNAKDAVQAIADRIEERGKFLDLSELLDFEQINESLYYGEVSASDEEIRVGLPAVGESAAKGLCRFVTIWGPGLVNINTASAEVLAALSETMGMETAKAVVTHVNDVGVFLKTEDMLEVQGVTGKIITEMAGRISTSSGYFSALCFAETRGVRSAGIGIIERNKKGCRILRLAADDNRLWQAYREEIEGVGREEEEI